MSLPRALIMAGGRGERMARTRSGGGGVPKPLVPLRGVPLLERALVSLLAAGFRDIVAAISASAPEVAGFVAARGRDLARAAGADVSCLIEDRPLGTIGAAGRLGGDLLLVVNADNLMALDHGALLAHHRDGRRPAMTVAVHDERFAMPFGRVGVEAGRINGYIEKPTLCVPISSGVYVLDREALGALATGAPASVPALVQRLLLAGAEIRAYRHDAPWIDINDQAALDRAEALVTAHADVFERWPRTPDIEVVGALIEGPLGLLVEWRPAGASAYPAQWDTPGGKIAPGEAPADAIARELDEELGLDLAQATRLGVFDDLDAATGKIVRHHVFLVEEAKGSPYPRLGQALQWMPLADLPGPSPRSPVIARSIAALQWMRRGGRVPAALVATRSPDIEADASAWCAHDGAPA